LPFYDHGYNDFCFLFSKYLKIKTVFRQILTLLVGNFLFKNKFLPKIPGTQTEN